MRKGRPPCLTRHRSTLSLLALLLFALAVHHLQEAALRPGLHAAAARACPFRACNLTALCARAGGGGIALAYDSASLQDGAGSQLHRSLLTHLLAAQVAAGFLRMPLLAAELHGEPGAALARWNALLELPSRGALGCSAAAGAAAAAHPAAPLLALLPLWLRPRSADGCLHLRLAHKASWGETVAAAGAACATAPRVVLHAGLFEAFEEPGGAALLSSAPVAAQWRQHLAGWLLRSGEGQGAGLCSNGTAGGQLRVAVHVRRGDVFVHPQSIYRVLDNGYYLEVLAALRGVLGDLEVTFYMDAVRPEDEAALQLAELRAVGRLAYGHSVFDSLAGMVRADVLVMSRSSFSYLAALLREEEGMGGVVYHPFWHVPRRDWLVVQGRPLGEGAVLAWLRERRARCPE